MNDNRESGVGLAIVVFAIFFPAAFFVILGIILTVIGSILYSPLYLITFIFDFFANIPYEQLSFAMWFKENIYNLPLYIIGISVLLYLVFGYFLWDYSTRIVESVILALLVYVVCNDKSVFFVLGITSVLYASVSRDSFRFMEFFDDTDFRTKVGAHVFKVLINTIFLYFITYFWLFERYIAEFQIKLPVSLYILILPAPFIISILQGLPYKHRKGHKPASKITDFYGFLPIFIESYKPLRRIFKYIRILALIYAELLLVISGIKNPEGHPALFIILFVYILLSAVYIFINAWDDNERPINFEIKEAS